MTIITYQDFEKTENRGSAIIAAVSEYKAGSDYRDAVVAQKYYARENEAILKSLSALQRLIGKDLHMVYHKLCSGFFPFFVKQLSQYLLGNGVTLEDETKEKLGPKFDKTLQKMGIQALVDGVNWGFWNQATARIPYGHLHVFRATEFVPLYDEITANLRAGIRWTQVDEKKPIIYELFTERGITTYQSSDGTEDTMQEIGQQAYLNNVRQGGMGERELIDSDNYPTIPIFPLYANELKQSEFNGMKDTIDAYDHINSGLIDSIIQVEGVYWMVKNFGGEDERELVQRLEKYKALVDDGDSDSTIDTKTIEVPYQAKKTALESLRKDMFRDFMALDQEAIQGGSLTNVAINVAKTNLDLKADTFEWQCTDFVEGILSLLGIVEEPKFKRRTITNDTETINNISTMLSDGYVDEEWAVKENPLISDIDQAELLERLALERANAAEDTFPFEDEELAESVAENMAENMGQQSS